jgi:hypothetical protein
MNYSSPFFSSTDEDPEYEARKVLSEIGWDGTLPVDPLHICEMYGIECVFGSDSSNREEGSTKFRGEGDFYIFINTYGTDREDGFSSDQVKRRRQRFTLAHELAHCIYKSHTDIELQKSLSNQSNPHSKKYVKIRESQANRFAAYLLIPRKSLKEFSKRFYRSNISSQIQNVADTFDVSMEVAAQQIATLAEFPCICILFNQNGIPKKIPAYSEDFQDTRLFYPKHQEIPQGTGAARMLSKSNQDRTINRVFTDASVWFPEKPWIAENFSLKETSISLGKYGIISFIEIREEN